MKAEEMVRPGIGENANIVDVEVHFLTIAEQTSLHYLSSNVGGLLDSHREAGVTIIAKRSDNDAEVFGFIIQGEGAILHRKVKFREVPIAAALPKYLMDVGQRIDLACDC